MSDSFHSPNGIISQVGIVRTNGDLGWMLPEAHLGDDWGAGASLGESSLEKSEGVEEAG